MNLYLKYYCSEENEDGIQVIIQNLRKVSFQYFMCHAGVRFNYSKNKKNFKVLTCSFSRPLSQLRMSNTSPGHETSRSTSLKIEDRIEALRYISIVEVNKSASSARQQ